MDAAASEFKPGEAAGGRGKVSFESPSIVKISEFRPQPRPLEALPDFSPASRRLASAASAPEFKLSFSSGAVDALSESFSRKVAFDSPSIARVSEFQPHGSPTSTYGRTLSSPNRYGASSDGTCTAEPLACPLRRPPTPRRPSPPLQHLSMPIILCLPHLHLRRTPQSISTITARVDRSSQRKQVMAAGASFLHLRTLFATVTPPPPSLSTPLTTYCGPGICLVK
jgi:hypothetical protein